MNRKFLFILVLLLAVGAVPATAHATGVLPTAANIATSVAEGTLDFLLSILGTVEDVLNKLLSFLGGGLDGFLSLPVSDGGFAVYAVWKTIRDICNMFFLLLMIAVAFGTIFNTLKANPFHWRGALLNILIAAIAINFSLAVGQTLVEFSNIASKRVIALFGDVSAGNRIGKILDLKPSAGGGPGVITPPGKLPAPTTLAKGELTPDQLKALNEWGEAGIQRAGNALNQCLSSGTNRSGERLTVGECFDSAKKVAEQELLALGNYSDEEKYKRIAWVTDSVRLVPGLAIDFAKLAVSPTGLGQDSATGTQLATINQERADAGHAPFGGATNDTAALSAKTALLTSKLFRVFMLFVLNLALIFVAVFMAIRLPISWFLLAVSAGAFFGIAVPNSHIFKQWLNNMVGWSIFGPLYLLNIYFGLYLLEKQSGMLVSLVAPGGNMPFAANLGPLMFFIITCAVFSVGAMWTMKFSFSLISVGGGALKGAASYMGMDEAGGYGLKTTAKLTGLASRYEGAKAGLGSVYQRNVTQPLARRDEEVRARYQARFGDRGAVENLQRNRIKSKMKEYEEQGLSVQDMKARFGNAKAGSTEYFALGQALLKEGELSGAEMKALGDNAASLGGVGQNAVRQAVSRKISEQIKDKKYRTSGDVADALSALPEADQERFLRDLKKNDIVLYAQSSSNASVKSVMAVKKMDVDASGNVMTGNDILQQNLSKIEADNLGKAIEVAKAEGWTLDQAFDQRRDELLSEKGNYFKILDNAKGPERAGLAQRAKDLKKEARDLELTQLAEETKITSEIGAEREVMAQERLEGEREDRQRAINARNAARPGSRKPTP